MFAKICDILYVHNKFSSSWSHNMSSFDYHKETHFCKREKLSTHFEYGYKITEIIVNL